ncbi:MAG: hypothetical protein IT236_02950 [Bacteroidia bacterium]|nr:hypothetical protein [Bacteroidia bacterium]
MNKTTKFAIQGAFWVGLANSLINAFNQMNEMKENPNQKFDWERLLKAGGKGALLGGVGGLAIGAIADHNNKLEKPINTDAILLGLLPEVKLSKTDSNYQMLDRKATKLTEFLQLKLGDKLSGDPMRLGSTEKGMALADNFDIDICLPFKSDSYASTAEMYEDVFELMESLVGYHGIINVRDQRKSVGVIFELRGDEYKIDLVPYKITAKRGNKTSGYLYVNDSSNPSYTKTDIHKLKSFKLTETQKRIVVLLKHWKALNDIPLSSHLLEHLVKDASDYNQVPRNFTKKLVMVLRHIHDNLDTIVISSVENSNNIVTDISENKKTKITDACKKVLDDYEYQPNSILEHFEI